MNGMLKKYPTIGCCGIDCGLCPRFYTKGESACPGCGGLDFDKKHPSCGLMTCCVAEHGYEVCSYCEDYPCKRFDSEKNGFDSFVTHKKIFPNLDFIKGNNIDHFLDFQRIRMKILQFFLKSFDDGRSKSFYCIGCALLPFDKLKESYDFALNLDENMELKEKNKLLKNLLLEIADSFKIELKLYNKK